MCAKYWMVAVLCVGILSSAQAFGATLTEEMRALMYGPTEIDAADLDAFMRDKVADWEARYRGREVELLRAFIDAHPTEDDHEFAWAAYVYTFPYFSIPLDEQLEILIDELLDAEGLTKTWIMNLIGMVGPRTGKEAYWQFMVDFLKEKSSSMPPENQEALVECLVRDAIEFEEHFIAILIDDSLRENEVLAHVDALQQIGGAYSEDHVTPEERASLEYEMQWFQAQPEWWLRLYAAQRMTRWTPLNLEEVVVKFKSDPDPRVRAQAEQLERTVDSYKKRDESRGISDEVTPTAAAPISR